MAEQGVGVEVEVGEQEQDLGVEVAMEEVVALS